MVCHAAVLVASMIYRFGAFVVRCIKALVYGGGLLQATTTQEREGGEKTLVLFERAKRFIHYILSFKLTPLNE